MTGLRIARLSRLAAVFLVALMLGPGLTACGKKSALTPPEGAEYPKQYPRR